LTPIIWKAAQPKLETLIAILRKRGQTEASFSNLTQVFMEVVQSEAYEDQSKDHIQPAVADAADFASIKKLLDADGKCTLPS